MRRVPTSPRIIHHLACSAALAVVSVVLAAGIAVPPAFAWIGDAADASTSGNATYEAMAIAPSAVYDASNNKTVIAYQGDSLDPYVCVFDHATSTWSEPLRIGFNPLSQSLDTHGGPSLIQDDDGFFHIFWGAHNSNLFHAKSTTPHDARFWGPTRVIASDATYPQPVVEPDGSLRVWLRKSATYDGVKRVGAALASVVNTDGVNWRPEDNLVEGSPDALWYGAVERGPSGTQHALFVKAPRTTYWGNADPFDRRGLYYLSSVDGEEWMTSKGATVTVPLTSETLDASCTAVPSLNGMEFNQAVVRELPDGSPCVLYLEGDTMNLYGDYSWRFSRLTKTGDWTTPVEIATTDHFFDAGEMVVVGNTIHAYLVTGGQGDSQARVDDRYALRGGEMAMYTSDDNGVTWSPATAIRPQSSPNVRYNDPQAVRSSNPAVTAPLPLMFSEWNNDPSAYFHKVFLWGDGRFAERSFMPLITRLWGADRSQTAVRTSQEGFPSGATAVVLARKDDYPDALCGVPLAQSYRAPMLLVGTNGIDSATLQEITRLRAERIVVLGGKASISDTSVAQAMAAARDGVPAWRRNNIVVERIAGVDRYETSAKIATRLSELRGAPGQVIIASGMGFADALAASPYAARVGSPVLLTKPQGMVAVTRDAIVRSGASEAYIAGGPMAVSENVQNEIVGLDLGLGIVRANGANRYETARLIVERGLNEDVFGLQRFVVASGEMFPDALTGSCLAARVGGPILLTRSSELSPDAAAIAQRGQKVLDAYMMGGTVALSDDVAGQLQLNLIDSQFTP